MKISGALDLSGVGSVTAERQSAQILAQPAQQRRIEDPIDLSSAARARESAAAHPRFGGLSVSAHQNPELADQLAYDLAHAVRGPAYDLSGLEDGSGPMKYAGTGEPVTPEREAHYKQLADSFHSETMALYNQERANGTAAADIFDKLVALGDTQAPEFQNITDWLAKLG